jgi:hypothetical protein
MVMKSKVMLVRNQQLKNACRGSAEKCICVISRETRRKSILPVSHTYVCKLRIGAHSGEEGGSATAGHSTQFSTSTPPKRPSFSLYNTSAQTTQKT